MEDREKNISSNLTENSRSSLIIILCITYENRFQGTDTVSKIFS